MEVQEGLLCTSAGCGLSPGFNKLPSFVTDTVCLGRGDASLLGPGNVILRRDDSLICPKRQEGATLMGLATRLSYVCRTCPCNADRALCHRHGVAPPKVNNEMDSYRAALIKCAPNVLSLFVEFRSQWQDAWYEKWPKRKQELMYGSIDNDAVIPDRVNAMVKRECGHAYPSRPRLIQYYPNLATQAKFGPEFFAIQKAYCELFQRFEIGLGVRVTFASGMNAVEMGHWMDAVLADIPNARFYERDGKSWDATMQAEHMRVRLLAYASCGDEFLDFVRSGENVVGRDPRGVLKYKLRATVKSGHNDTTLGNSLVNAGIAFEAMVALRLQGDIIVAGDDLLVVVDGDFDDIRFSAVESDCGIRPEYRKFDNVADVSFVSGVWFKLPSGCVFCPKPGRLLARLFWTVRPPPAKKRQLYLNAVVSGLLPTCHDVPVIADFLRAHFTVGIPDVAYVTDKFHWMWSVEQDYNKSDLFEAFCSRYQFHYAEIVDCVALIRSVAGRVGMLSHPVLDRIMEVDLADLADRPLSL